MGKRGRIAKGEVDIYQRTNGLTSFYIRVPYEGRRLRINLGTERDGWTWARAEIELANVMARIEAGVWTPPTPPEPETEPERFHAEASRWLERRKPELRPNTYLDYRWRLVRHLLPFFADCELAGIDADRIDQYKEQKLLERAEIVAADRAGTALRDVQGRKLQPLSNESINKTLGLLAAILDDAMRKGRITSNPARERGTKLRVTRVKGSIMEADELVDLIEAAEEIDRPHDRERAAIVARIVELRDVDDQSWGAIAAEVELAMGSVIYHYEQSQKPVRRLLVRRAIIATLGRAGLRVTELCNLDWAHLDFTHNRIKVADAKTESGVREVDMSPKLVEELIAYREIVGKIDPDAPAFPTRTGARRDKGNIANRVIVPAVRLANKRRDDRDLPPLPEGVTPHTLRRTYISLLLEAGASLPYVMQQVGHQDSKTTLEIYAGVLKRRDRGDMGTAFDDLLGD